MSVEEEGKRLQKRELPTDEEVHFSSESGWELQRNAVQSSQQSAARTIGVEMLDVVVDREATPIDFQVLASIWLEGCELR